MGHAAHLVAHVAVADEDEFGVGIIAQDVRHGADEDVRPLLHDHAADEQNGRIERADGVAAFDLAGIDGVIEGAGIDAVVDDVGLVVGALVQPADLVLELVGHGDDSIGAVGAVAFVVLNARRLTAEEAIAVAAILGRVHGQHGPSAAALLDPDQGVGGQPVVGVDDVEAAHMVLHGEELVDERPAHVVDFVDEIRVQREVAAMVVNAVDAVVVRLLMAAAGEHMDFMAPAIESRRQFRDVDANSTHGDAVQCFPRKQCNLHNHPPGVSRIRAAMILPFHSRLRPGWNAFLGPSGELSHRLNERPTTTGNSLVRGQATGSPTAGKGIGHFHKRRDDRIGEIRRQPRGYRLS